MLSYRYPRLITLKQGIENMRGLQNILRILLLASPSFAWQAGDASANIGRRQAMVGMGSAAIAFLAPSAANAGIDPTLLKTLPVQGDESGAAQRLRQVEAVQKPASDLIDIPFTDLPSGVSYREYREGKGEAGKKSGSEHPIM